MKSDNLEIVKKTSLPLTLPEMAKQAAVSEVTLYRLFRKGTGESPVNCLNRVRLRHARALLLNTRLPISEVAAATGFADSNYFSRRFRKFAGMSPREFRESGGKAAAAVAWGKK